MCAHAIHVNLDFIPRQKPYGELEPLHPPSEAFATITADFIVKLPPSKWQGKVYDSILVVVDALTKYCVLLPYAEQTPAEDVAQLLLDRVFSFFGLPRHLVSDRAGVRVYTNYLQDDWASWLPLTQLAYNSSEHSVLHTTPADALWDSDQRSVSISMGNLSGSLLELAKSAPGRSRLLVIPLREILAHAKTR